MIMMTSLLADKSVMMKIEILMNFMKEIINPQCNSLFATFFETIHLSEDSVIFHAEMSSSHVDNKSAVQTAVSPSPFVVPEENVAAERGEESHVEGPEGPIEVGGVCETEAGTEADVEDEDEHFVVLGDVDEVGVSGYESEGFTLSEIFRRMRLKKNVTECVLDTAHLPQCEFSNLHR